MGAKFIPKKEELLVKKCVLFLPGNWNFGIFVGIYL